VPALPSWLTEPLWDQFAALLPPREMFVATHPWGCHRRRIADRIDRTLPVSTETVTGYPIDVLADEARHAKLLVLGTSGLGGLAGVMAGSDAAGLAGRAACPVVGVRGADRDPFSPSPVVPGLDGTEASEVGTAFAFDAAAACRVPLIAVHTCSDMVFGSPGRGPRRLDRGGGRPAGPAGRAAGGLASEVPRGGGHRARRAGRSGGACWSSSRRGHSCSWSARVVGTP
jgi:hypothetical protein